MTQESLALIITVIITQLVSIFLTRRQQNISKNEVDAEARSDNAAAEKTMAEAETARANNYDRIFHILLDRDSTVIELNGKLSELTIRFDREMKMQAATIEDLNQRLSLESSLRQTAESQRDKLQGHITILESKVSELELKLKSLMPAGDD
jgi:hypothetical protein